MLWLYQRDAEMCLIETVFDNATHEYVLVTAKGLPTEREERFADGTIFQARLVLNTKCPRDDGHTGVHRYA